MTTTHASPPRAIATQALPAPTCQPVAALNHPGLPDGPRLVNPSLIAPHRHANPSLVNPPHDRLTKDTQ